MPEPLGSLCIVLHGHLPYVLHHGTSPHGEAWLYEAMAETYLPLLDLVGEIALNGVDPALTIGLTPVLLEQLSAERIKAGFVAYVKDRVQRAKSDHDQFMRNGESHLASLAEGWEHWYLARLEHFERIKRDIPGEFAARLHEGHIQVLTSAATHAYLPLLLTDEAIRAQLAAGAAVSSRIFGGRPKGIWLPECAYRPASDQWKAPVLDEAPRPRAGIESFLPAVGVSHTFVDAHMLAAGEPLGTMERGHFVATSPAQLHWDHNRGWREAMEPVGVVSEPGAPGVFAFARHPRAAEQVWSSKIGYPGDGAYLEFHKKHGRRGLRYWRVTDVNADLGSKHPYDTQAVAGRLYAHAQHFCGLVREVLGEYRARTGRAGVCVAAFDAELFGHWWFEGPRFLRDVILTLGSGEDVARRTAEQALEVGPHDKVMRLPEGSWGRDGNHGVWLNEGSRWMWEVEHRAEATMVKMARTLPWRKTPALADVVRHAGRELLLLQASDWPFVVESKGAVDYGIQRFSGHATRFDRAVHVARDVAAGRKIDPVQATEIAEMAAHDTVFSEIDPAWWI